jgi:hypothetical protein
VKGHAIGYELGGEIGNKMLEGGEVAAACETAVCVQSESSDVYMRQVSSRVSAKMAHQHVVSRNTSLISISRIKKLIQTIRI